MWWRLLIMFFFYSSLSILLITLPGFKLTRTKRNNVLEKSTWARPNFDDWMLTPTMYTLFWGFVSSHASRKLAFFFFLWRFFEFTKAFHGVNPHHGAVFLFSQSHGAVRSVFLFFKTIRCGAVRFSLYQNHTVRCGAVFLLYGAVPIVFFKNRTVRCGTVIFWAVVS